MIFQNYPSRKDVLLLKKHVLGKIVCAFFLITLDSIRHFPDGGFIYKSEEQNICI